MFNNIYYSTNEGDHSSIYKEALFVLSSLAPLALPELVTTTRAIILPVCMGVARPFLPSLMSEKYKVAEEMFTLPSANLYRQTKAPVVSGANASEAGSTIGGISGAVGGGGGGGGGGEGVSDSESEVGEGEETHTHGDASSTATVGSGPIPFFSDQVGVVL